MGTKKKSFGLTHSGLVVDCNGSCDTSDPHAICEKPESAADLVQCSKNCHLDSEDNQGCTSGTNISLERTAPSDGGSPTMKPTPHSTEKQWE
jgi:hypothetical protein